MDITPDALKIMAAKNVASYKSMGTSLNDSISKSALEDGLNSDQVKRLVETTNQMAYLSELDGTEDRTFEFDVANYDDVMNSIISDPSLEKSASTKLSPMDLVTSPFAGMEKVASEEKVATLEKWGRNDKLKALQKIASHNRRHLDELKSSEHDNLVKLAQHRAIICRDPEALQKMAKFDNQLEMTKLVFGHDKVASDVRTIWSPSDLSQVGALSEKLTMIKQASDEMAELEPKVLKAEGILKEAFLSPAIKAAKSFMSRGAPGSLKSKGTSFSKKVATTGALVGTALDVDGVKNNTKTNYNAWSSLRG